LSARKKFLTKGMIENDKKGTARGMVRGKVMKKWLEAGEENNSSVSHLLLRREHGGNKRADQSSFSLEEKKSP